MQYDNTSHKKFVQYYLEKSKTSEDEKRALRLKETINIFAQKKLNKNKQALTDVLDVGCGPGIQSIVWAKGGCNVHAVDVNESFVAEAKKNMGEEGVNIDFRIGSATSMPWADESFDVCLVPELLEHVSEWLTCLKECVRVLKPHGILYISTTNKICPLQHEYNLPLFSWYPNFLKNYYYKKAITTRKDLASYATYPAINWFTPYSLTYELKKMDMISYNRFEIMHICTESIGKKLMSGIIKKNRVLDFIGHLVSRGTRVVAYKREN